MSRQRTLWIIVFSLLLVIVLVIVSEQEIVGQMKPSLWYEEGSTPDLPVDEPSNQNDWQKEIPASNGLTNLPKPFERLDHLDLESRFCPKDSTYFPIEEEDANKLRSMKYLIALNMHDNEAVLGELYLQIVRLVRFLHRENVFISIYESGSTDTTAQWTKLFATLLTSFEIRHHICTNSSDVRDKMTDNRIEFLARMRNIAMAPLYHSQDFDIAYRFDRIIFINDVYFCMEDVVRLLIYDADVACGLDLGWNDRYNQSRFYDTWVGRDANGMWFDHKPPFVPNDPPNAERIQRGQAIPVSCCWNGMAMLNAKPFYEGVRFRLGSSSGPNNCGGSECSTMCIDFHLRNYSRMIVDPQVRVTYDTKSFLDTRTVSWINETVSYADFDKDVPTVPRPVMQYCCPVVERDKKGACRNMPMEYDVPSESS